MYLYTNINLCMKFIFNPQTSLIYLVFPCTLKVYRVHVFMWIFILNKKNIHENKGYGFI